MFLVCESIARGLEHTPFNAALLKTISFAFPNDIICFYAEDFHLEEVREQIGNELAASIVWKKMVLPSRHSSFYTRVLSDFKTAKFLLNELNKNPRTDVLVITGNASILWALKYYVGTKHNDKRVQVIIHGDFSTLHRTPRKSVLNPFYYVGSLKTALKIPGYKRLQHIVLEETVRDAILKKMPFLRNNLSVLDHPIPVDKQQVELNNLDPPIQFGYLGRASEKKGFSAYLAVASEISRRFPGQAKFHIIGPLSDKIRYANYSKMNFLTETPGTEEMSRNEYVKRLKRLHFVCLFHNKYYESCASGVLMDSIAWEKPIIATQLPIFENIEQRFGDIGYLCRKNEFIEAISSIIKKNDSQRYRRQVVNMSHVKASRIPEKLAMKYLEIFSCLYSQNKHKR
jgi:glycosyltransferase involved in cell wall biosynthesis